MPLTRVLLIEDHPIVRMGVASLLKNAERNFDLSEAASRTHALEFLQDHKPDLIILDLILEHDEGIDLIKEILGLHAEARILVMSMQDEMIYAERAMRAGALGYLSKMMRRTNCWKRLKTAPLSPGFPTGNCIFFS